MSRGVISHLRYKKNSVAILLIPLVKRNCKNEKVFIYLSSHNQRGCVKKPAMLSKHHKKGQK